MYSESFLLKKNHLSDDPALILIIRLQACGSHFPPPPWKLAKVGRALRLSLEAGG